MRHPFLIDTALGAVVAAPAVLATANSHHLAGPPIPGGVGFGVFAWIAVSCRRLRPWTVLVVTGIVTTVAPFVTGSQQPALTIALVVAVYTVASRLDRHRTWLMAAAVAVPVYVTTALSSESSWWAPQNLGVFGWIGMAAAIGDAGRSRQAYVTEVEERARRAEQSRDDEARRRVVEERIRIARELHDVVSHHIAMINVQAGAARHVLHNQPQVADTALEHIRHASDTVLRELASAVGVLRQADDLDNNTEPTRGLARLADLLATSAAAGLRVDHHQEGPRRELPSLVDLAAYRILQEALTNAHKHGTGTASVLIKYAPRHVLLEVTNRIGAGGSPGGYGLIGMRERATAAGGTLSVERRAGDQFRIHAVLPAPVPMDQP